MDNSQRIQVEVFWVVAPCSVLVDTNVSKDLAASMFRVTARCYNPDDLNLIFTAVKTSVLS